jgi:hypothetical protein
MYPVAGLVGKAAESPRPGLIYCSLSGITIIVSILYLFILRHHTKISDATNRTANSLADEARKTLASLKEATDIAATFDRTSEPLFLEALARDLRQTTFAQITTIGHGPLDKWTTLWNTIASFSVSGGKVRIISDAPPPSSSVFVDYRRVPDVVSNLMRGVFAVDCVGSLYFGVGTAPDNFVITRFDGRRTDKFNLASSIFLLTEQLSNLVGSDLNNAVTVRTAMSPAQYKELVLTLEGEATRIDRLPKRIFVVFKSPEIIRSIAEQRYGIGSNHVGHYVQEHHERSAKFFSALGRGMVCREIYNKSEVITYVQSRKHGRNVTLTNAQIEETLVRWRDAILSQPHYLVGLTDDRLPFKYELIDGTHFIMHEAIGQNDEGRMNAFCITGVEFCKKPISDFEIIWNSIPRASREPKNVAKWIEKVLREQKSRPSL